MKISMHNSIVVTLYPLVSIITILDRYSLVASERGEYHIPDTPFAPPGFFNPPSDNMCLITTLDPALHNEN